MTENHQSAKSIFLAALDIESRTDRDSYVEAACNGSDELLTEVKNLLVHQGKARSFLEFPVKPNLEATIDQSPNDYVGGQIGPYKIRERIGDGGMGVVYVAEQEQPLRRKVALKVIKPGMDSKAVLGRFDAERNALALMNHPNISKVLDAGTTAEGRPYFVMELVKGGST